MMKDKKKNYLFLDIDGVMNRAMCWKWEGEIPVKSDKIQILNYLYSHIKPQIVISSSWRKGKSVHTFQNEFQQTGFDYPNYIISKTPVTQERDRSREIKNWLKGKDYESYLALDDKSLSVRQVQTKSRTGLTKEDADKVINKL